MEGIVAKSSWQRFSFFDFIVEFLGSLLPGIVFTVAAIFALAWPFWAVVEAASGGQYTGAVNSIPAEIIKNAELGTLVALLCISYVLGHLFFRQDPNDADRASFLRLRNALINQQSRAGDAKPPEEDLNTQLRKEYACEDEADVKFPYPYLADYLEQRGLRHLMWFVLWREKGNKALRTKNYINVLKIRLGYYRPGQCISIARNEAHIRLISSTWHLCRGLILVSAVGLTFALIRVMVLQGSMLTRIEETLALLAQPVLVLAAAGYIRWKTEKPLHYMRLREIIFVLETAYTAFRQEPRLIRDVFPNFQGDKELCESQSGVKAMANAASEA